VRYLLVGGFNTVFGYGLFAWLNWAFTGSLGKYSYLYASFLGGMLAITVAFLGYKWFVFRTKGNYLKEWIRCVGIYGSSILIGLIGMPILVPILEAHMRRPQLASYLAGAIMTAVTILFSFFGHKNVSFRQGDEGR
jgi:putative flippase GtrA